MQDISNFLDSELARRSSHWKALRNRLAKALPAEFMERISYATLDDGKLTLFSDAPEWTSKLRFHSTDITEVFAAEGFEVRELNARTVPKPVLRPPVEPDS